MNAALTALIIPAKVSDPVRIEALGTGLEALGYWVAGAVESITRGDWEVYLNAEGTLIDLPANLRAAQLMHVYGLDLGGVTRGTAVFLGRDAHGGKSEVPEHLIRRTEELFGVPRAA
jgi:hypothetical protein